MRKGIWFIAAFTLLSGAAQASNPASSYYVSAPVVRVDPIYTTRTIDHPIRRCTTSHEVVHQHDYERRRNDENYFIPGLFGGVVGGLIGSQFGGGSGKKALTVVGALAGASIARDAARHNRESRYPTKVCHTTFEKEVVEDISAYDVTYEYGGQQFSKRMSSHPGETVRVRVQVSPVLYGN